MKETFWNNADGSKKYVVIDSDYDPEVIDYYIRYAKNNNITKYRVRTSDLNIINRCENIEYLYVFPIIKQDYIFDYSPVYNLENLKDVCFRVNYEEWMRTETAIAIYERTTTIDYSKLKSKDVIERAYFTDAKYHINRNSLSNVKTISLRDDKTSKSLYDVFSSKQLDVMEITNCRFKNLEGIQQSEKLQCISLNYNRRLIDISQLLKFKNTLKYLHIEKCSGIKDYSVLQDFTNLEDLYIENLTIPNLDFIKYMPNLKAVTIFGNIIDGNLDNLLNINYVKLDRFRKHYNHKAKEFKQPFFDYKPGTEGIPEWRVESLH